MKVLRSGTVRAWLIRHSYSRADPVDPVDPVAPEGLEQVGEDLGDGLGRGRLGGGLLAPDRAHVRARVSWLTSM